MDIPHQQILEIAAIVCSRFMQSQNLGNFYLVIRAGVYQKIVDIVIRVPA